MSKLNFLILALANYATEDDEGPEMFFEAPDGTEYPINGVKVEIGTMKWDDAGTEQFTPYRRPIRKITLTT